MSSRPSSPSPIDETPSLDGWERAVLDRQLEALGRLADMAMAIAAAIERQATAAEPGPQADLHRASMDFSRVSRAVRLTYALQSRLIADFKGRPEPQPDEGERSYTGSIDVVWDGDPPMRAVVQKRQMRGLVQRVAEAAELDREAIETLVCEARERLEDEDFHDVLINRPVGEVLAIICAELGLDPDWDRLSRDAWAQAEIARSPPGSPFFDWKARRAHEAAVFVPSG
jgi:hypothetical protein